MNAEGGLRQGREVIFLLGVAGSGKTSLCLERLRAFEARGERAYYLVPEQSTYLADRQILEPPGPEAIRHVRVVSYRRLALLLEEPAAALAARPLDRSGRRILLRALFSRLDPALRRPFEAVVDRPGFLESLVGALREVRDQAGPRGADILRDLGDHPDLGADVRAKIAALSALRTEYDEELARRGLRDPELLLLDAPARILANAASFRGLPILVDGFLSFTRLETDVLAALVQAGARLTIALCLDPTLADLATEAAPAPPGFRITEWPKGFVGRIGRPGFLAPLRTLAELRSRMHAAGFPTRVQTLEGSPRRFRAPAIVQLESRVLSRAARQSKGGDRAAGAGSGEPAGVTLLAARDPAHEVEIWARTIDRWIRLDRNAVRPGEVAVVVRDLEAYRPLVEETFARYRVPVFVDRHWDISSRPLVRTILDALDVLRTGWQRDAVLSFLRSSCLGTKGGEIDLVENLALEAGYDYTDWTGEAWIPLRRPPRTRYVRGDEDRDLERGGDTDDGQDADRETAEEEETETAATTDDEIERVRTGIANRVRSAYLEPLKKLERALAADGIDGALAVDALRGWMAEAGLRARVTGPEAEREANAIDHVLGQIAEESREAPFTLDSFARLLMAGLGSLKLGRTPTRPDAVILADVQRSRLGEVRRAVLGGLSARDFPRAVASERFFNEKERSLFARLGLDLGTPDPLRQEEEAYFLYIALTRCSEELVLTRPTTDIEGGSLDPSPFIKEILVALPGLAETVPRIEEDPADLREVQTVEELAARVGAYIASRLDRRIEGRRSEPDADSARPHDRRILTAYNRLVAPAEAAEISARPIVTQTGRLWGYENRARLPAPVVELAVGASSHATSVGRLESFARCPYQHFARHMLRLEPRPRAEITPLESGLLTHRALEVLMREGPPKPDQEVISGRLKDVFDRIDSDPRFRAFSLTPGGLFRKKNTLGRLTRFLEVEARRLDDSDFRPSEFEREFGAGTVPPLVLTLPDDRRLLLRGRIDRIDIAETEQRREALVLDYKSGTLTGRGRPADLRLGLDLQLAVYLLVVREVFGMEPFGALYVPVLPRPVRDRADDPMNPLKIQMTGLIPMDEAARVANIRGLVAKPKSAVRTRLEVEDLLAEARATLSLYGRALLRGVIDIAPAKTGSRSPCDSCPYASLCRVDETYNRPRTSPKEGLDDPGEQP